MAETLLILELISTLVGVFFAFIGFKMFMDNNTRETQLEQIKYFVIAILFFV